MKLSAKSKESLDELVRKYHKMFLEDNERDFANIAYSANVGRATFNHRAVIIAKNLMEAANILETKSFKQADVQATSQSLCFLFTGQGSQYPGMGKQLYETSRVFRDCFDRCDKIIQRQYDISIKDVIWSNEANMKDMSRTLYSQTSIFVVEYCLLKLWESWGIKPDYVIGHSLGEYAAAVATGALNLEDALLLVAERSRFIDNLPQGKMLVIKADKKTVDEIISEFQKSNPDFWVDFAALNSPDQTVVAGDSGMIEEFGEFCTQNSLKTIILAATHAFHSRHMEPILDVFRSVTATTAKKPEVQVNLPKYISGMDGKLVVVDAIDADYWVRHTREKVNFMDACKAIQKEGCTLFLEVGPHPVLSALTMMNNNEGSSSQITCLPSIRKKEDEWVTMLDTLSKLYLSDWKGEIDWKGFDKFYSRQKVKLPFYPFNRKPIWTKFERKSPDIHPLIGTMVPTALGGTVFQSSLTPKNTNFIQDHVIGNTVVFPGAGFLEMGLAGGHSASQGFVENLVKPKGPILLKKLKIASPLALYESSVCKLQTVVTLTDENGDNGQGGVVYSVQIFQQQENEDGTGQCQWIQHASAKFLPGVPRLDKYIPEPIDIKKIQSDFEKKGLQEFYQKLLEIGLRFGPKFLSLECSWTSEKGLLTSIKVPEDCHRYLIHPVVADAMFQTVVIFTSENKNQTKKKLKVPVHVGEYIWLKDASKTKNLYAYATVWNNSSDVICTLLDDKGLPLALMRDMDFMDTTAEIMEGMITQQSAKMPKIWRNVWRSSQGPMQGYLTHLKPLEEQSYSDEDLKYFEEKNRLPDSELKHYQNLVNISRLSILKALYSLGWKPKLGEPFTVDFLTTNLKIKGNFRQYIRFYMRSMALADFGLLKTLDEEENTFKFIKSPPSKEDFEAELTYDARPDDVLKEDYRLVKEVKNQLVKILIGEVDPLGILFPDGGNSKSIPSAGKFYDCLASKVRNPRYFRKADIHMLNATATPAHEFQSTTRPTYRWLEVGAGTATFTEIFLKHVFNNKDSEKVDLELYFTDVSGAFFRPAEEFLKDYAQNIVFKTYDIEKDPLEQGFCPGYFDMISAGEVLHIAKDLKKTLQSLRSLLKPGGLLHFLETVYPCERNTFVFGLLDGFWQFEDRQLRQNHVCLSLDLWKEVLLQSGFTGVTTVPFHNSQCVVITAYAEPIENKFLKNLYPAKRSWIVFGDCVRDNDTSALTNSLLQKLENVNRKCTVVPKPSEDKFDETVIQEYFKEAVGSSLEGLDGGNLEGIVYLWSLCPNTRDQAKVSLPFLTLMKQIGRMNFPPKVFSVVRGAHGIDCYDGVVDPTSGTLVGFSRSVANENRNLSVTCLDLDPLRDLIDQSEELFMNLWVEHSMSTAFRDGLRLQPKMAKGSFENNEPLPLPNQCNRFQLTLAKSKLISDLEFAYLKPYTLGENDLEVQVKAMALNFRDVFAVLKPSSTFDSANAVGVDCAGVVVRIGKRVKKFKPGDRVVGMSASNNLSLPSYIKTPDSQTILLPKTWSYAEGATVPAVFTTAYYCLVDLANMKTGETVLIHTASGGVGLIAIQLCKHIMALVS